MDIFGNKKRTLRSLVKKEADKLKRFATQEEIAKLNFGKLEPTNRNECIYGQMTGDCYSGRANELIVECAERVYSVNKHDNAMDKNNRLNGAPTIKKTTDRKYWYHSPIEMFIAYDKNKGVNSKRLIDYLKGYESNLIFD